MQYLLQFYGSVSGVSRFGVENKIGSDCQRLPWVDMSPAALIC